MATIVIITKDNHGNRVALRALCDPGAQINLITIDAVQKLNLRRRKTQISINGINGSEPAKGKSDLIITSRLNDTVNEKINIIAILKLPGLFPSKELAVSNWPHIRPLALADKHFYKPAKIDMILGANFYSKIITDGLIKRDNAPTAQKTRFGWIVFGYTEQLSFTAAIANVSAEHDDDRFAEIIAKFWEIEHSIKQHFRTPEVEMCEQNFIESITRNAEGRYVARIPIKPNHPPVEGTRAVAFARLRQMHKRFERDSTLQANYVNFMQEYENLGHMVRVPEHEYNDPNAIYIPHHAAAGVKKFRTVFDGSCRGVNGVAINDIQMNSERLQPEITITIMRLRVRRIALCADIVKMYRQILVPADQYDLQRILWSESFGDPIREYRLITQTYGLKASAYTCVRVLKHAGEQHQISHPKAARVIKESFYVDDVMDGEDDEESAIETYHELNEVLNSCGLPLAKWTTNSSIVRADINGSNNDSIEIDKDDTSGVLGLNWRPSIDAFHFTIKNPP